VRALITGAAGFVGAHLSQALLDDGAEVVGVDNLNAYYDPALKTARLKRLAAADTFSFHEIDVADYGAMSALAGRHRFDVVVHLAAQAGVRYSVDHPFAYGHANLSGHLSILEMVRRATPRPFLVYASSSSVYGNSNTPPYGEADRVDSPASLYAATKRSCELLSESYTNLYALEQIGLRFFTVYGPWGRPDMAYWTFARKILDGEPICVFNNGKLQRDFTWIDDIVDGVVRIVRGGPGRGEQAHRIYNIGNNRPVDLLTFIETIETALGRSAVKEFAPMQIGDVYATAADISRISRDYGFVPKTPLEEGIGLFADWFKDYREGRV
jgi:UDP-glucuronate 4-epimerase